MFVIIVSFISHLVQIKLVDKLPDISTISDFISHLVQIKL